MSAYPHKDTDGWSCLLMTGIHYAFAEEYPLAGSSDVETTGKVHVFSRGHHCSLPIYPSSKQELKDRPKHRKPAGKAQSR